MDKPLILFDSRFNDGTPTATDTAAGFDVLHLRDLRTYTWWKGASSGTKYLTANCPAPADADTFAVCGHNWATAGATVSVEKKVSGSWSAVVAPFTPTTDGVIVKKFAAVTADDFRVKIVTASAAALAAVVLVGSRLDFPEYFDTPVTPFEEKVVADTTESKTGNLLGVLVRYFPFEATLKASQVDADWYMGDYRDFWTGHGRLFKPFFFAPALTDMPDFVTLCRMHKSATFKPTFKHSTDFIETFEFRIEGVGFGL